MKNTQNKKEVVLDEASNLMWFKGCSDKKLKFEDAIKYVDSLNKSNHAGFNDWRIPTIDEALSLMNLKYGKEEDEEEILIDSSIFIHSIFGDCTATWTSDINSDSMNSIWVISFMGGNLRSEVKDAHETVIAVRSYKK